MTSGGRVFAAVLVPALVSVAATLTAVATPASAAACPDVEVVFARGTFEPHQDDPVCSPTGRERRAHSQYAANGMTDQAANFAAGRT